VLIKTYVLFQGGFRLKQWELEIKFNIDPLSVKRRETSFVNMENGIDAIRMYTHNLLDLA